MVKRTVVWTEIAKKQRRSILKYWINHNKSTSYSEKLIIQIANRIQIISKSPYSFKKTNFPNTRVSAMGNYSIFYQVNDNHIIITAFWDNRQNPEKLFKLLK